jgi:hypothetical protein
VRESRSVSRNIAIAREMRGRTELCVSVTDSIVVAFVSVNTGGAKLIASIVRLAVRGTRELTSFRRTATRLSKSRGPDQWWVRGMRA